MQADDGQFSGDVACENLEVRGRLKVDGSILVQPERWLRLPNMAARRAWHTVQRLPNGRALAIVGSGNPNFAGGPTLLSAEIYDSATNKWTPAASMPGARSFPSSFPLSRGRVLVAEGQGPAQNFNFAAALLSSFAYDYATNVWTATGPLPATNNYRPVAGSSNCAIRGGAHDGDLFVAGAYGFEDPDTSFFRFGGTKSTLRFDVAANTWVSTAQMSVFRGYAACCVALGGGKVLVGGGASYNGHAAPYAPDQFTELAEIYDADADTFTPCDPFPEIVGEMSGAYPIVAPPAKPAGYQARRAVARGVSYGDGKALVIGGLGPVALNTPVTGPPFVPSRARATCWVFDLNKPPTKQWRQVGSMAAGRCWPGVITLATGEILAFGGIDELWSQGSYLAEIFSPITETWRQGPDLPLASPQPAGAQRPIPIFAGLSQGPLRSCLLTTGEVLIAGSHELARIDQILVDVFFGPGEVPQSIAAKFVPGAANPGTPPGAPLAPIGVDTALAGFLNAVF